MARFVVGFGNRSFFPPEYMKEAREEIPSVLREMGHEVVLMDEKVSKLGAVQTRDEGRKLLIGKIISSACWKCPRSHDF